MKGFTPLAWSAIGVAVAAIVIGAVAIPIIGSVATTGFSATDYTIWTYVQTFMILALLIGAIAGAIMKA